MPPAEDKSAAEEDIEVVLAKTLDMPTFQQILEMDEPDDPEFSWGIVEGFFEQAESTFAKMDEAVEEKDLKKLSELGHYLKGSSATLGLINIRDCCEKIQRYGKKENVDGSAIDDEDLCMERVRDMLPVIRSDYKLASRVLKRYYKEIKGVEVEDDEE